MTCTSKTAKITKGDIACITLTVCQCAAIGTKISQKFLTQAEL